MNEREEGYMQQHLCSCMIDIAGEGLTVVNRDADNPVAWPEILVLQSLHGDQVISTSSRWLLARARRNCAKKTA